MSSQDDMGDFFISRIEIEGVIANQCRNTGVAIRFSLAPTLGELSRSD